MTNDFKGLMHEIRDSLNQMLCQRENDTCQHEETSRGGTIWEICNQCGCKWADDEGGRPEYKTPKDITQGYETLTKLDAFLEAVPDDLKDAVSHIVVDPSAFSDCARRAKTESKAAQLLSTITEKEE